MSNYANVRQIELCPQCGGPVILMLDDYICRECGWRQSTFDVPDDQGALSPFPATSSVDRLLLPDLPAPFKLTTKHDLQRLMKEDSSSNDGQGGERLSHGWPTGSISSLCAQLGCPPETKQKQWPSHEDILDAIIRARNVRCPFYVGGGKPCSLHPLLWTFCDGNLVTAGVLCENRKEEL